MIPCFLETVKQKAVFERNTTISLKYRILYLRFCYWQRI